jgi:hypothetical protein
MCFSLFRHLLLLTIPWTFEVFDFDYDVEMWTVVSWVITSCSLVTNVSEKHAAYISAVKMGTCWVWGYHGGDCVVTPCTCSTEAARRFAAYLLVSCWTFRHWRWRKYVRLKRWDVMELHGVTSQKIVILMETWIFQVRPLWKLCVRNCAFR